MTIYLALLAVALSPFQAPASSTISGLVVDPVGGALAGARIVATCNTLRADAFSDASGRFHFEQLPAALCTLSTTLDGFTPAETSVDAASPLSGVRIQLAVRQFAQQIVVTPSRGQGENTMQVEQAATLVDRADLEQRPYTILTQA